MSDAMVGVFGIMGLASSSGRAVSAWAFEDMVSASVLGNVVSVSTLETAE